MAKDYSRPPAKRKSRKRNPVAQQTRRKPTPILQRQRRERLLVWLRVIAILALIALVIGGLTWLRINKKAQLTQRQAERALALEEQRRNQVLPEPPVEEYTYKEALKTYELQVEVPEQEASRPRYLQCASFRLHEQADTMRARIALIGLEADIQETEGTTGLWYRVTLGPYPNRRAAQRDVHTLQNHQIPNCEIRLWTPQQ